MSQRFYTSQGDLPSAADLYCDLEDPPGHTPTELIPGFAIVALVGMASAFLADRYAAPLMAMSLLIGFSLSFLGMDSRFRPGLFFVSGPLLRVGIILLGARITFAQLAAVGLLPFAGLVGIMALAMLIGVLVARALGLGAAFGILASAAVAVCGASAAVAVAALLGRRKVSSDDLSAVLLCVIALSSLAMLFYPILLREFAFTDLQAGFVLGASIHDVAQSIGAGYGFSESAGQVATIVKLGRVALLVPLLLILGLLFNGRDKSQRRALAVPWFILGFITMAVVNSLGLVPSAWQGTIQEAATAMIACAVAASAMLARTAALRQAGLKPMAVILSASLASFAAAILLAASFGVMV